MDTVFATPEDEVAALRRLLAERDAELAASRAQLSTAALEIERLRLQLAALRRVQFGRSSERHAAEVEQLELRLEDLEEGQAEQLAGQEAEA